MPFLPASSLQLSARSGSRLQRGFTLVEVMIATAIVAGICLFLTAAIRMGYRSWQVRENAMSLSHELRRGMAEMTRELAECQGTSIDIPADGNWYNQVTFRVPEDLDQNGTVLDAQGNPEWGMPIQYGLGDAQVVRSQGAAIRVMANGATQLAFRRQPAAPLMLEVALSAQRGANLVSGVAQQGILTSRVRLRN